MTLWSPEKYIYFSGIRKSKAESAVLPNRQNGAKYAFALTPYSFGLRVAGFSLLPSVRPI